MKDEIEAREALHKANSDELHFRFLGTAKARQFVLNIQFGVADDGGNERLRPEEYDFMIGKFCARSSTIWPKRRIQRCINRSYLFVNMEPQRVRRFSLY